MTRVALVNLASLPMPGNEPIFPIGLRCVQDALHLAGHETRLIDFVEDPGALADLGWAAESWDVIGFTIRNIDPIDLAATVTSTTTGTSSIGSGEQSASALHSWSVEGRATACSPTCCSTD